MRVTQGTFSYLPDFDDDRLALHIKYSIGQGWAMMVEHTDDPHPRNSLWEMWEQPRFDVEDSDAHLVLDDINACRAAFPDRYIKVVAYDSTVGRQTTGLSIMVNRPENEPGFRLDRQENHDRMMRYSLHSYATEQPTGYRYGATGAQKEARMAPKENDE